MKKNKRKQKQAKQQIANKASAKKSKKTGSKNSFWKQHQLPLLSIFLLAVGLYIYSTGFDYALDDHLYITGNQFTQKGIAGIPDIFKHESLVGFFGQQKDLLVGGRYRPLAIASYALGYQFTNGDSPGLMHFFNILLYGLTGILLYRILYRFFPPPENRKWYLSIPFMAAAIYIAHPLHVEVIANIKGRVEIMALLFALSTLYLSVKYVDTQKKSYLIGTFLAFFLALMTKESPITFLAILPLSLYFFTQAKSQDYLLTLAPLLGATAIYFVIRYMVLGYFISSGVTVTELLNDPFVQATFAEKYATIFYTLGLYIKLLFFPLTLTHDYYPKQLPIIGWSDFRAILSFLLYIGIGLGALYGIYKKHIVGYGLAFYLITFSIVSNVFVPIGTFMNERFLYIPSIGFAIILAYIISDWIPNLLKKRPATQVTQVLLGIILVAFSLRTLARVPAWESNETLFLTDVETSTNSSKANTSAGGILLEMAARESNETTRKNMQKEAIEYLNKALKIHPNNTNALLLIAGGHYDLNQNLDKALPNYLRLLKGNKNREDVHNVLRTIADVEEDKQNVDKLIRFFEEEVLPLNPDTYSPYKAVGALYGKHKQNPQKAIEYLSQAVTKPDAKMDAYQGLGIAYSMTKQFEKAIQANEEALKLAPDNPSKGTIYLNLSLTHREMGNTTKADKYLEQAKIYNPRYQQPNNQ